MNTLSRSLSRAFCNPSGVICLRASNELAFLGVLPYFVVNIL